MVQPDKRPALILGLFLIAVSVAPSPAEKPRKPSPLAEARYQAAIKQFDEVWTFYRQSRTESFPVYSWSLAVLSSQSDLNPTETEHLAALEGHLQRMKKLETLVKRVRRLGFGFSIDVGASEYYRLEAELWLEQAKTKE